jgi:RimJ/RimL family protein N-acetyltransferase
LRRWIQRDREPFARINADPEVTAFRFAALSRRESDALIEEQEATFDQKGYGLWAVERTRDRRLLGFTGLGASDFGAPFCPAVDIGWQLAREVWGQGFATEGALAVLAYAFNELALPEGVAHTTRLNQRSRAVMSRIGMTHNPVDDFDGPWYRPGHPFRRFVLYRISAAGCRARPGK